MVIKIEHNIKNSDITFKKKKKKTVNSKMLHCCKSNNKSQFMLVCDTTNSGISMLPSKYRFTSIYIY